VHGRESDEPGICRHITYSELLAGVCKIANAMKSMGVAKGMSVCSLHTDDGNRGMHVDRNTNLYWMRAESVLYMCMIGAYL
jgi:hypothetical protein